MFSLRVLKNREGLELHCLCGFQEACNGVPRVRSDRDVCEGGAGYVWRQKDSDKARGRIDRWVQGQGGITSGIGSVRLLVCDGDGQLRWRMRSDWSQMTLWSVVIAGWRWRQEWKGRVTRRSWDLLRSFGDSDADKQTGGRAQDAEWPEWKGLKMGTSEKQLRLRQLGHEHSFYKL